MTNLTEGLKVNEKERDASVDFKKTKTMTDCNTKIKKKVKSKIIERDQWSGPFDFIVSMIAYAVGLGSFLLVYVIFFSLGALPVFIMEITIGQYAQRGAMEIWNLCPLFKGVGIGNVVIAFMCIAYFCVISSWSIFYMINSFSSVFPWETCNNWWNDRTCITGREDAIEISEIRTNLSKYNLTTETSVEQYWERRVLMQTSSISNFGGIQWELLGIMTLTWIIVYFALWKGITRARRFVYFCALSPYFMLAILLLRGLTLPGATVGIYFYLTPNATKLWDITVWKDAGTQVSISSLPYFKYTFHLSVRNKMRDSNEMLMIILARRNTNVLSFVVFSILGYMSVLVDKNIAEIVKPGPGLAFLAYPEVASNLPLKQLWSMLFFLMITILGLDSQICMLEGLYTALEDVFPHFLRKYKKTSLALTCLFFFILGIPMAGSYWLILFDAYGASGIALLFVVFFEITGLSWGF
ncbi:unnamed protein product, partial [Litomosoides sigmodontis]